MHLPDAAELMERIKQWHRPEELKRLVRHANDSGLINGSPTREPRGLSKWISEEVVPLYSLGLALEAGADGRKAPVEVRAEFGDQPVDAEVRFGQSDEAELLRVQITWATINGHQDALSMEYLRDHGHAVSYPYAEYEKDKGRDGVVRQKPEPMMLEKSSVEKQIVDAAFRAAERKTHIQYPADTTLLVWLREYNPDGMGAEARAKISARLATFAPAFSRVFVMGFATEPIVVRTVKTL